ncbi:MAG: cobalamin-dependent protein, partial [Spirochaetes bacterium]|nr:cobalamin-dependent protein [Spirochaetota bacterium]
MNCLLIKCHAPTLFRLFNPIVTEPLELEYLAALLSGFGIAWRIHDRLLDRQSLRRLLTTWPADVYLLSGYNTAVPELLATARRIRKTAPTALIVAGGVQAELCPEDFFITEIDLVFRSGALCSLRALLNKLIMQKQGSEPAGSGIATSGSACSKAVRSDSAAYAAPAAAAGSAASSLPRRDELRSVYTSILAEIPGLCWQDGHGWHQNANQAASAPAAVLPNRRYLYEQRRRTHYLEHRPVALLKAALSCPYSCSFCCCCQLNAGKYLPRAAAAVLEEIRALEVDTIWLVDDCLFTTRAQAEVWLAELRRLQWHRPKHIIAYIRADFAAANPDILAELA